LLRHQKLERFEASKESLTAAPASISDEQLTLQPQLAGLSPRKWLSPRVRWPGTRFAKRRAMIREKRMATRTLFIVLGLASLAGCGGSAGAIVGSWTGTDNTGAMQTTTFKEDGTYQTDIQGPQTNGPQHVDGTYAVNGGLLTVELPDTANPNNAKTRGQTTFYISADGKQLAMGALLPQGNHNGVVGAWKTSVLSEKVDQRGAVTLKLLDETNEITFTADGKVTQVITSNGGLDGNTTTTTAGTWRLDAATNRIIAIASSSDQGFPTLTFLDGQVLGTYSLVRK
jgi:hypothetical protein